MAETTANESESAMDYLVRFSTGNFPFSVECQCFFMAIQGAMMIRKGPNRTGHMHWFHAFVFSVLGGFAGGWLGFVWMGKPSSMLASDINFGSCILAFALVNYTPLDVGYMLCNTLPVTLITTSFAQLFRSLGIMKFIKVCFETFKDNPSPYYPIPVFGPILYATLLGNMGGIVMKGLEGHVQNGMPWPVQNGFFCAAFYHFFVNDADGPIGTFLRSVTVPGQKMLGLEDHDGAEYAAVVVTIFMQLMGILQLPEFLGPTFTPFGPQLLNPWKDSSSWNVGKAESAYSQKKKQQQEAQKLQQQQQNSTNTVGAGGGKRRKNRNAGGKKKTN